MSLSFVKAIERLTGRMRGHVLVEYQTSPSVYLGAYKCNSCGDFYTYVQNSSLGIRAGAVCPTPLCGGRLALDWAYCMDGSLGTDPLIGTNSPSCGFPIGVFWNFVGSSSLWAHELGHNRHYEHAADAMQNPLNKATAEHDSEPNSVATFHTDEAADNKRWDRACLMTYILQVREPVGGNETYDDQRDMPCFCFKCVLKNRGWRITALPIPKGDLRDP